MPVRDKTYRNRFAKTPRLGEKNRRLTAYVERKLPMVLQNLIGKYLSPSKRYNYNFYRARLRRARWAGHGGVLIPLRTKYQRSRDAYWKRRIDKK